MKKVILILCVAAAFTACKQKAADGTTVATGDNKQLAKLFDNYYEGYLKLDPVTATFIGDTRYNDQLPNDGAADYLKRAKDFYQSYLDSVKTFKREDLDDNDKLSYDIFVYEAQTNIDGYKYHLEYMPFNQIHAFPLTLGQLGSGGNAQPFKTVKDYNDWLKRLTTFAPWADTAIANFNKGIKTGVVLPKALVVKMIPQMQSFVVTDATKSIFYDPIKNIPASFSAADKKAITDAYKTTILTSVVPAYKRLADYLQNVYLPKSRSTSGLSSVTDGTAKYAYLVKQQTSTNRTPEEIYQTGLSEVARIGKQMDSIKTMVGFKGDRKAFFEYMRTDRRFMPYKTPADVLAAFENIHKRMEPNLKKMFNNVPKTQFIIKQTEAFRAESASIEYNQGSADGKRPGIFYVPIVDAAKFNTTSGMESTFLHEAIPGHHYQISLTQENNTLPKFRRFLINENGYAEGWALYSESLGKELGLYTDPYQHMGALGDEMHRAIRLVVDVAIHTKGMTREQAVKYSMDNEAISEPAAIAEIERYMGAPAQALGYKTGALKILELRKRYQKQLGAKFNLAEFHNQVLKDGAMPLSVLETKMDAWAKMQQP
ncbi:MULTISPECIES: DUF885 domain-containing protein [unclassified Mucilaginibacter]|uniref:DUF885 domain-containing protein n=1 Tax=unclassified Mucilaginibacter TaxID=2617802 RepID=UPI002AC9D2A0|nr:MULTISPECIES: DUF885 domain-containing protein [unclassified Mucilaginibacter]MEB0260437.1 DUF885 domain-containing protein [Mucilaginibacter sp. 10I4]MEB0280018.1 DUF885 domain-containing protein [Mucilaginibacter sp. 10B2]MEB0301344.1 DUF885 domain-containing protein [Mucilaginibacter sp. 5C4]WPX23640.1 DUF885 domain-containing protein [Mucilaginibacter sp. 5C4]